jgi:oligo-1,6-glucosidase
MVYGSYDLSLPEHELIYAFTRTVGEERLLVIFNFSQEAVVFTLPGDCGNTRDSLLIGNYQVHPADEIRSLNLQPYEARVYRVQ